MKDKKQNFKVGLFSMPVYHPVYMHPAMPYLAGYLEDQLPDVQVIQRDLNTSAFDYFLGGTPTFMRDIDGYRDFQRHRQAKQGLSDKVSESTQSRLLVERNSVSYDSSQKGDFYDKSREGLLSVAEQKEKNLFYEFFRNEVLPFIEREGIDLVALSASDQKQLVPTIVLASMIKEYYPDIKVAIGGNIITRNYDVLSQDNELNRRLFDHFDYLIHHEGEVAIRDLIERLRDSKSVEGSPKLIYKKDGRIRENLEFVVEDVNSIPAPDFDDLVAQRNHWTPKSVIPYLIGRGCDWGACTFCDIPAGYDGSRARMQRITEKQFDTKKGDGKRRNQSLDKVIQELDYLSRRYDTKYFSFGDEELAGDLLRSFVDKVLESGLDIEWECYGRIEDLYLDKEFCEKLSKSGCRFIQFGVESASQKVLDMSNKGYDLGIAGQVLRNTYEAGIMNHAFLLVGLPEDSLVEASKLIPFLERNGEYITTLKPIYYKVSKWSPIALHPERKGVKLDREGTPDLDVNINLASDSGLMSRHNAEALVRVLDLWTKYNHSVNPATSEYMYAQRLFLSRGELEEFGRSAKPEVQLDKDDLKAIKKVYNGLVQEVKTKAYDGSVDKDARREYEQMYLELKNQRAPNNLEGIVSLLKRTALVNNQTAYEPEESKDNIIDLNSYRKRRWSFRSLVRPIAAAASIAALVVGSWLYTGRQGIDSEKHVQDWGRTYFAQLSEQKPEHFNPIVRYVAGNKSLDKLNAGEVERIATLWEMDATGQEFVIQSKNPAKLADYNAMCRFRTNS